jgi:hypothetical protein
MQNNPLKPQTVRAFLRALQSFVEHQNSDTALGHWQKYLLSEGRWEFGTYVRQIKKIDSQHIPAIVSSLSQGQIESKLWLYSVLKDVLPQDKYDFHFAGGWTGLTALVGLWLFPELFKNCESFDIDPRCADVAKFLNEPYSWNGLFSATTLDLKQFSYQPQKPQILVNTICEHIDFANWYQQVPAGQFLVLQSNNLKGAEGHISCVDSLQEFMGMAPLKDLLFAGELELFDYTRFMLIGAK